MNDDPDDYDKCSGCGEEPHPNFPCSEARALRAPAKQIYIDHVYVVWVWASAEDTKQVTWAGLDRDVANKEANAMRVLGWRARIKKTKVVF